MNKRSIQKQGFYAAALANIGGVLLFSKCFTNDAIPQTSPVVMSYFGLFMIVLWGLAYAAVANHYQHLRALVGVFVIEKLAYVIAWVCWMSKHRHTLPSLFDDSVLAGTFMSIYGINDALFLLFFLWVFFSMPNKQR